MKAILSFQRIFNVCIEYDEVISVIFVRSEEWNIRMVVFPQLLDGKKINRIMRSFEVLILMNRESRFT